MRMRTIAGVLFAVCGVLGTAMRAQAPAKYEPSLQSLDRHPLPEWYAGAKLGIFIHWGLYSVPGWAPLNHPDHDFCSGDYIKYDPYAEWYLNTVRIPGSPTEAYDREHYGPHHDYYSFAEDFNNESKKWNPDEWAEAFQGGGRALRGADQQAS